MLYTPETALNAGQATELLLLFTHPAHGGPDMAMAEPEAFAHESDYGMAVFMSEDAKEGPLAFKEKRTPNFQRK